MTTPRRRHRSRALLIGAAVLLVLGLLSVGAYAISAISVLGQADQSMLFWMLPFLLFGLALAGVGVVLAVLWLLLDRTRSSEVDQE